MPPNTLAAHYLQVQALTPENPAAIAETTEISQNFIAQTLAGGGLPLSIAIFFILLTIGIMALLITRVHDINKILTVMFLALVTSTIPYGTQLVTEQATIQTKASLTEIPKQVVVSDVTATGFTVTWRTDDPNLGAIRYRTGPEKTAPQKSCG
jgi:hypothetical protein